jgi:WD40 repeat protein
VFAWTQRNVAVEQGNARATAQAEAEEQRNIALEQSDIAMSRYLSARALASRDDQLDLSLLLAVQAAETSRTSDARGSLLAALSARPYLDAILTSRAWKFVQGVGLNPDGTLLAVSYYSEIEIWDLTTYSLQAIMEFPEDLPSYTWLGFSMSTGTLIGCGPTKFDKQVQTFCRVWDLESGEDHGLLVDGIGRTEAWKQPGIAISPGGRLLTVADDADGIYIYSVPEGDLLQGPLTAHEAAVTNAAFNPHESQLATADSHGRIILWDIASGEAINEIENVFNVEDPASGGRISSIAFSPDGKQILAVGDDHSVLIDSEPLIVIKRFHGYGSGNLSAYYHPDGTPVVQTTIKEKVYLWDASTGQLAGKPSITFLSEQDIVAAVLDLAHMRLITANTLTGIHGVNILVWDLNRRLPFLEQPVSGVAFTSVAYHPDPEQHMLVAGGCARYDSQDDTKCQQGEITFWDSKAGQLIGEPVLGHKSNVEVLAFNPEGSILASASADGDILLWDVKSRMPIDDPLQLHHSWVDILAFSPNGQLLASAAGLDEDGLYLWDLSHNPPIATNLIVAPDASDWVEYLAFSPDGKTLASCTEVDGDKQVVLWDVQEAKVIATLESGRGAKSLAFFTPDGQRLLTAGGDGVRVWDSGELEVLAEPASNALDPPIIGSAALSPEGDLLASQLTHMSIAFWDTNSGQLLTDPIAIYDNDSSDPGINLHLAYSPDGSQIAIADDQGLFLWDMRIERWIEAACHMANRNLTREEWRTYMGSIPYQEICR